MSLACTIDRLADGRVVRVTIRRDDAALGYSDVLQGWRHEDAFRAFFIQVLAEAPFEAYRWETPPVTSAGAGRAFEFVLLDAPELEREPDVMAFADQFSAAPDGETVTAFANLGGDAVLVVPLPVAPHRAYPHLAAFVRQAPPAQAHALWRAVGEAIAARLGAKPVWLSTAGMGVSWLHVRLDSRPKYYGFAPYTRPA